MFDQGKAKGQICQCEAYNAVAKKFRSGKATVRSREEEGKRGEMSSDSIKSPTPGAVSHLLATQHDCFLPHGNLVPCEASCLMGTWDGVGALAHYVINMGAALAEWRPVVY